MKKHFLLLTAALSCGLYSFAQVSFGIKAGFSAASMSSKTQISGQAAVKAESNIIPAFHAGVIADIGLADNFYLQPGLFYSAKGTNSPQQAFNPNTGLPLTITAKIRLGYLELPVNFLYKQPLGPGKLFFGFGPYLGYGITGKVKADNPLGAGEVEVDVKFKSTPEDSSSAAYVKPFDAGANFMAGYELKMGLLFSINYSLGLTNTSPYPNETQKNHYLGVSVGYLFPHKK
ncbi:PorT family protein [Chitinophaga agrisoli]|uniref:PorT family protein n=1 Tax=Chitinophaga agrisoli TaxID=2607653 RepID=A0A5B2VMR6_9BACT|nr:porin family protein [Chitinophaga agrisoli]KAA2239439.1 PorT family protein [Chitinophaga agrisoli]